MNKKEKLAKVFHFDLYGKRDKKYDFLRGRSIKDIEWDELECKEPQYFFVKKDFSLEEEYAEFVKVNELFEVNGNGVKTNNDNFLVSFSEGEFQDKIKIFLSSESIQKINAMLNLKDSKYWNTQREKEKYINNKSIEYKLYKYTYRPFDYRFVYYLPSLIQIGRGGASEKVMRNLFLENIGLILSKQFANGQHFTSFITSNITDMSSQSFAPYNVYPLYLYTNSSTRQTNFDEKIIDAIAKKLNLQFIPDHEQADSGKKGTFNPLDVLDYIYAILHSPTYRERYKEFLKIDFPRVPFTSDQKLFWALVKKGRELREYHLMEHANSSKLITKFPISGENEITKSPKFDGSKVWINETQYFDKVPQIAWEFYIGGYQPAQKWLKDRRGRKLSFDEVLHYQKIIVALVNTDRVMKEIDKLIPKWPVR